MTDGLYCSRCEARHADWESGEKRPAGPETRGWVQPHTCQHCGGREEVTGL